MNIFFLTERASMLIPSGAEHNPTQKHLFVTVTNPWIYEEKQKVILVNLTSIKRHRPNFDDSCIIKPEDNAHAFISKASYINYSRARLEEAAAIQRGIQSGTLIGKGTICPVAFDRICTGLVVSGHTPQRIKNAYECYLDGEILS